ncbi:TPR repeat-containing protein DDB_G0287407-like isoform X1 [Mya arenaria]|uniref:TPR repeat-containing protein DDB_G0287407-like isoform X1 n=1 Tax=Mya arenaria TaxID=6604 RepID=UPI0022DFB337|nr:TPR repeat-containing protein DDB_G0287407-like isoform X1 [Mya arenaria]
MSKLKSPHVVKIFFSSPFGGMEEEREELTRRYWPSIAHLCNSHGLQFAAVDMRWGITAESSDKAQVINICLREIDRSDMFVGFFGQRYGWHGADDAGLQKNFDNALPRYPWLADVRDRSVTELEFLHGFLNNPGYIPATLFFRDKMYDDMMREEGVQKGDKKQVFKYSAESEHSSHMMEDLKQRVSENREKTLGVHIDYKTPAEAAKIMYETIMSYLKTVLFADLSSHQKSPREEVLSQHDAFLASRCNIYVHGEQYQDILNKQVSAEQPQHVYITGETGSGKSALLCNWVASLRENTVIAVAYHFCGFADNSTDVSSLLSRIVTEFEYIHTGKDNSLGKSDKNVETTKSTDGSDDIGDIRALVQKLQSVMGQLISRGKKPVLVVDGIDKVTYISKITKVLYWLPHNLPTGSLVVVSTLTSDVANITELAARNYLNIAIQPLDTDSKRDMAVQSLGASGKELSPPQLERIVAAEMTKIPLFLNITMAELIAFGYFRLLDKKIDTLINSSSIEELFSHMLGRLEEDYNVEEYQGNLVEQVLCCIELCSQGMSETILLEMFSIPGHIWTPLYYALENMVIHQGNMIKFGFKQLGDAVEAKYLSDPDKRNFYLQKLVDYFKAFLLKFDKSMLTEDSQMGLLQPAMKLPGLLVKLGDREALAHCLSNFFVFTYLCGTNPYQQIYLWRKTGLTGREIANLLLASFDQRLTQVYFNLLDTDQLKGSNRPGTMLVPFLMRVNKFLKMAGLPEGIKEVLERAINIVTESLEQNHGDNVGNLRSTLHKLQYDLACHLCESYHTAQQGIDLHLKLLAGYECQVQQQGKTDHLMKEMGHCCHGIGVGYTNLKQYDKVIEYTEKSIEHHKACRHPDIENIATSWTNIGMCHMHEERYEAAIEYLDNSIKTLEEYYFHEVPPLIGEILTNKALCLRRLNRLDEAEQLYFKSLDVKIKAVGRKHHIVAMAYMNLGTLESHRENSIKALEYNKQALEIYERHLTLF